MKFSSSFLTLGVLLALSVGCSDVVQPEPLPVVASITSVRVSGTPRVNLGGTVQLSAVALDQRLFVMPDQTFTWRSSDEAIATVSEGLVTAKAPGTVTISATTAGKKGEMSVRVGEGDDCAGCWDY
jgi:hypothetical protein